MADSTIKAKLILDTSGGLGAKTSGTGGLAGGVTGAGVGSFLSSIKGMTKILGSILFVLEAFKAPLLMLGQIASVLAMFLKPISDVVVWFLKPVLGILLRLLIPFLQAWNKKKEDKIGTLAELSAVSMGPLGIATGQAIETTAEVSTTIYDKIKEWASSGWGALKSLYETIKEQIWPWLQDSWAEVNTLYDEIYNTINEWLTSNWEKAKSLYEEVYSYVGDWISKGWDTVESFASMVVSKAREWISNTISSFTSSSSSGGIISSVVSAAKSVGKFITGNDVVITKDGKVVQLNSQDTITATKNGSGTGGNYSITINVNALDASSINTATINKITSAITEQLKRGTMGRTSYGIGV